jgi:hypothetical protein
LAPAAAGAAIVIDAPVSVSASASIRTKLILVFMFILPALSGLFRRPLLLPTRPESFGYLSELYTPYTYAHYFTIHKSAIFCRSLRLWKLLAGPSQPDGWQHSGTDSLRFCFFVDLAATGHPHLPVSLQKLFLGRAEVDGGQ